MKRALAIAALLVLAGSAGAAERSTVPPPSFLNAKHYATKPAQSVAIGDLNGDGKLDLVGANGSDDSSPANLRSVSVLLNTGRGSFGSPRVYATGEPRDTDGAWSVAIGDLNGDGKPDLATANPGGRSVSVLLNAGDGSFAPSVSYSIRRHPWDVAIADLNGDGQRDVVTANPNTVSVLLNIGEATFADAVEYPTGRPTDNWALAVADLNGDGRPDILTANHRRSTVSVLINRGEAFKPFHDYVTGPGPRAIAVRDLNHDGKPDVVTANGSSDHTNCGWFDSVSVLKGRGDGSFRPKRNFSARYCEATLGIAREFGSVVIADLNGDRKPDVATANAGALARIVSVFSNSGDGTLLPGVDFGHSNFNIRWQIGLGARAIAAGDLNGDGKAELVTPSAGLSVFVNRPGLCTVQEVRGKTVRAAREALARANCRVGRVRRTFTDVVPAGHVAIFRPGAGTVLPGESKVNLVVSLGRRRSTQGSPH
jgi:hypothetical protein